MPEIEVEYEETQQQPTVILSLCYSDGLLGAAVYDKDTTSVRILHDVGENDDYNIITSLFEKIEPTTVLISKSQDLNYIRFLSQRCKSSESKRDNGNKEIEPEPKVYQPGLLNNDIVADSQNLATMQPEDEDEDDYDPFKEAVLHLLPSNNYRFDQAVNRIGDLFSGEVLTKCETDIILQFRIDTKAVNMVRAFGALLRYMDAARIGVEYEMDNMRTPITAIKTFVVDQMVEMDWSTYRALDIFGEDKKKEVGWRKAMSQSFNSGASLFSLMNRCRSSLGKYTLMSWFGRPTLNRETLKSRQKAISFFIQDCNMEVTSYIHQCLGKMRNTKMILKRMRGALIKPHHWKSLYESVRSTLAIIRCLAEKKIDLDLLEPFTQYFGNDLTEVTFLIGYIVDFDESQAEGRLVVNAGVDSDLDTIKTYYRCLPQLLTSAAQDEATRLNASECCVGYVPIVGYILSLPLDFPASLFPDLKMIYTADDRMCVKSKRMNQLDEELGDIKMQIIDKETTTALRLQKSVLEKAQTILGTCKGAAVLDAVISMAMTARQFGWNCPMLTSQPIIEATQCVHPLIQMLSKNDRFVPNMVSCGGRDTRMKIFTGPNACGKSVYMKQVGILAFLTHIGSFVPAQRATIGPINRIMTRVYTVDGVLDGMSSFAKDVQQISLALRRANQYSLVIIDEFGKGTLTEIGLSLLASSLNYWLEKGDECPHVLVSSHFHSLPNYLKPDNAEVSYHTFEVVKQGTRLDYQFRLVDGLIDCSHAAYTAGSMGIPQSVVLRSNEIYQALRSGLHPSELTVYNEDKSQHNFLAERMDEFSIELETWDIENSCDKLLTRIEELLLCESEHMIEEDPSSRTTTSTATQEDVIETPKLDNDFPSREGSESTQIDQIVTTEILPTALKVIAQNIEAPVIPGSILKSRCKSTPSRGNLSVSFANTSPVRISAPVNPESPLLNSTQDLIMKPVSPIKDFDELFSRQTTDDRSPIASKRIKFN